ncbi:MAG TPA: hypothetical protein VES95_13975, partial [Dermatophilaceae bacterium]|nr:hypothetical protein [Dermatophilaceae bacterium]
QTAPRARAAQLRRRAREAAEPHDGVLSREELRALAVDHRMIRREVAAERWRLHGIQTVGVHTGPLGTEASRWRAVWEVGLDVAALDGATALDAAGLRGYADGELHVSVRHTARVRAVDGVRLHKVVRRLPDEVLTNGVPRVRPAVAAVRAAHWASTDRQAALVLAMPVQQRIVTGAQLVEVVRAAPGRNRRALVGVLASDIVDGAHSLGELDLVEGCRRRGLPEPRRQAVRRLPGGTAYLDLEWEEAGLVVEVDGSGHVSGLQGMLDDLRQNAVSLGDELVLRVSLLGWRLQPQAYLDQICAGYFARLGRRRSA